MERDGRFLLEYGEKDDNVCLATADHPVPIEGQKYSLAVLEPVGLLNNLIDIAIVRQSNLSCDAQYKEVGR